MTRLPNNVDEAREWAKLKTGERYWIAKAFLLGYRFKPPGQALVIAQRLYDDAWRLGRRCKQHEQEAKARAKAGPPRASGASTGHQTPRRTFRAPLAELYEHDRAAKAAGLEWSAWLRLAAREKLTRDGARKDQHETA